MSGKKGNGAVLPRYKTKNISINNSMIARIVGVRDEGIYIYISKRGRILITPSNLKGTPKPKK